MRHYVDVALMRLLGARTKAGLRGALEAHRALSLHGRALSSRDLGLVRDVIERLARGGGIDGVRDLLQSASGAKKDVRTGDAPLRAALARP